MKKVAVVVLVLAVLMLSATVTPVMAKAEKVPVAGLSITTGGSPLDNFRVWTTNGRIEQARGLNVTSISKYWIGVTSVPDPAVNPTYVFSVMTFVSPARENTKLIQVFLSGKA